MLFLMLFSFSCLCWKKKALGIICVYTDERKGEQCVLLFHFSEKNYLTPEFQLFLMVVGEKCLNGEEMEEPDEL